MRYKPWQTPNRSFNCRAINTAGSNRESRGMTVYVRAHCETQLDSSHVIVIDLVHCKSSKKLSSGIIILTVTNTPHTLKIPHTRAHTHKHKTKNKITWNTLQNNMHHVLFTVRLLWSVCTSYTQTHKYVHTHAINSWVDHIHTHTTRGQSS